ncbi:hypothetical protein PDR5_08220 [Pseudomonas sp. DR 5-09]|nr:hypothetical protein PDR5_08220 [Pseudomonas sp. DR 5-09]
MASFDARYCFEWLQLRRCRPSFSGGSFGGFTAEPAKGV